MYPVPMYGPYGAGRATVHIYQKTCALKTRKPAVLGRQYRSPVLRPGLGSPTDEQFCLRYHTIMRWPEPITRRLALKIRNAFLFCFGSFSRYLMFPTFYYFSSHIMHSAAITGSIWNVVEQGITVLYHKLNGACRTVFYLNHSQRRDHMGQFLSLNLLAQQQLQHCQQQAQRHRRR